MVVERGPRGHGVLEEAIHGDEPVLRGLHADGSAGHDDEDAGLGQVSAGLGAVRKSCSPHLVESDAGDAREVGW